jgi:hypothetical protein
MRRASSSATLPAPPLDAEAAERRRECRSHGEATLSPQPGCRTSRLSQPRESGSGAGHVAARARGGVRDESWRTGLAASSGGDQPGARVEGHADQHGRYRRHRQRQRRPGAQLGATLDQERPAEAGARPAPELQGERGRHAPHRPQAFGGQPQRGRPWGDHPSGQARPRLDETGLGAAALEAAAPWPTRARGQGGRPGRRPLRAARREAHAAPLGTQVRRPAAIGGAPQT